MPAMTQYTPELIERFYSKISKIPTEQGCLEWMAYHDAFGHGYFGIGNGRTERTHRIAWALVNGPIPAGLVIRHMCNNPYVATLPICFSVLRPTTTATWHLAVDGRTHRTTVRPMSALLGQPPSNASMQTSPVPRMRQAVLIGWDI